LVISSASRNDGGGHATNTPSVDAAEAAAVVVDAAVDVVGGSSATGCRLAQACRHQVRASRPRPRPDRSATIPTALPRSPATG